MLSQLIRLTVIAIFFIAGNVHALTADDANAMAAGETDARIEHLNKAVVAADDKTLAFLQALSDDAVKLSGGRALVVRNGKGVDPITGVELTLPDDVEDVINNNRMGGALDSALAALKLFSADENTRVAAIAQLQRDADETKLPLIDKAFAGEQNPAIKEQIGLVRAAALLAAPTKANAWRPPGCWAQAPRPIPKPPCWRGWPRSQNLM